MLENAKYLIIMGRSCLRRRCAQGVLAVSTLLFFVVFEACTSGPEDVQPTEPLGESKSEPPKSSEEKTKTHYVLRKGPVMQMPAPLPWRTDIWVEWHYDDGSTSQVLGFRGWDFDRDGRFEMIEVLDLQGNVQSRIYDFDGDGQVDMIRDKLGKVLPH